MKNNKKGFIRPFLALILLLAVSFLAFISGGSRQTAVAKATLYVSADYQTESAIIQILQKAKNNPNLLKHNISKEILPGVVLSLTATRQNNDNNDVWCFNGEISSVRFTKKINALGSVKNPSKIVFMP